MSSRFVIWVLSVTVASVIAAIVASGNEPGGTAYAKDIGEMIAIEPADVSRVDVEVGSGSRAYERIDGRWFQVAPRVAPLKSGVMPGVLEHLLRRPVWKVGASEAEHTHATVSLTLPRTSAEIDVLARGLAGQGRLRLGEVVIITDQTMHDLLLETDLESWCDATLFPVSAAEVTAFKRTSGEWTMSVEMGLGGWVMTQPVTTGVDEASLDQLLSLLSLLEHGGVVVDEPASMSAYGLDPPTSAIEIKTSDGQRQQLLIGHSIPGEEPRWYAITGEGGPVVALEEMTVRALHVDPAAVIDRIASPLDPDAVMRITITDEQGPQSVVRGAGGWTAPDGSEVAVQEVDRLLELLTVTMATDLEVVAEYPDHLHVAQVVLSGESGAVLDTINILREEAGGRQRWGLESEDHVLRVFPETTRVPVSWRLGE